MLNKYTLALPLVLTLSLPALAGISKNVTQEDAAAGLVPVVVAAEGGGTILDFSETQETLLKVTLDDPSKVLVDYTTPLPVVRLFRGNIPAPDVPAVTKTQLTVVTQDAQKQYHTYIFSVLPSSKPAIYTKFVIGGETQTQKRGGFTDALNVSNVLSSTATGIRQAEQQRTLVDPALKGRVRKYLQLTQGGMPQRKAAKKAGVSMALVQRLDELGQSAATVVQSASGPTLLAVPVAPVASRPAARSGSEITALVVPVAPVVSSPIAPKTPKPAVKPSKVAKVKSSSKARRQPLVQTTQVAEGGRGNLPPAHFLIVYNRPPEPNWTPVVDLAKATPAEPTSATPKVKVTHHDYATALLRGLNKARLDGKIRYGSKQWYSLNGSLRLLRRGASLNKAIAASGMKHDQFMKLLSDGG